jgi:prevent-host-death family protein
VEMSVREARAQFAAALDAASRGERVTITKNGKPVAELGPPPAPKVRKPLTWEELDRLQEKLGIPKPEQPLDEEWRRRFDDPAFSREALGLPDDWEPFRP